MTIPKGGIDPNELVELSESPAIQRLANLGISNCGNPLEAIIEESRKNLGAHKAEMRDISIEVTKQINGDEFNE